MLNNQHNADQLVIDAVTDVESFAQLYRAYYSRIYRFCLHRVYRNEEAEDLTAAVFLTVAKKIKMFKGNTEVDFSRWIYKIAANKANTHIAKTIRQKKLLNIHTSTLANQPKESQNEFPIDWTTLYAHILRLNQLQQTIITLRFFENMTHEQIAAIVGKKPMTVRVTLHRTLKELKDKINHPDRGVI